LPLAALPREQVQGRDRSAVAQSTGALIFFDTMAITKDAKHPNNAMRSSTSTCVLRTLRLMANEMNYPTGNKAAVDKIKPEIAGNKTIFVEADTWPR
jgi:putrescine transport system substrate-binding protein